MLRVSLAMLATLAVAASSFGRTWSDQLGTRHIDAEVVLVSDTLVVLRKTDGSQVRVGFDKLSHDDIQFLKDYVHAHPRPEGVPEPLKTDADKAADQINGILKKLAADIEKVAAQDTAVRMNTLYSNALKDLNSEIKAKSLEVRLTIKNVADDTGHTLTLDAIEGIDGTFNRLISFNPKYSQSQAVEISAGDVLVLRGHGRLTNNYQSQFASRTAVAKAICVLVVFNKTSQQYYGLQLLDFTFKIEKRPHPKPAQLVNAAGQPVAGAKTPAPQIPAAQAPAHPATNAQATTPNTPNGSTPAVPDPARVIATVPANAGPPANIGLPTANSATDPSRLGVQPVAPPIESGAAQGVTAPRPFVSRIDVNVSYAKYVKSKLTPDKYDQRLRRLREHYSEFDRWSTMPLIDIGHNYHTVFWRAIQSWPAERLALWLHHNGDNIGYVYWKQIADRPGVRTELDRLHNSHVEVDPNYVDQEFVEDPDLVYRDEFVTAVYNTGFDYAGDWTMPWTTLVAVCIFGMILLLAWTKYEGWF